MIREREFQGLSRGLDLGAGVLSHILSPAGVAVLVMTVLAVRGTDGGGVALETALAAVVAFAVIPALVVLIQARSGDTGDVYAPEPAVRRRMLMAGTVCYLMGYVVSEVFCKSPGLHWAGATFSAAAAAVWGIDRVWKISIHNTGAGGGAVLLTQLSPELWPLWGFLPVVVGWARWRRGAHDLAQLAAGTALGGSLAWFLQGRYL
jgi:hypothetical protein